MVEIILTTMVAIMIAVVPESILAAMVGPILLLVDAIDMHVEQRKELD